VWAAPDVALVLHPREAGAVLDAIGNWATSRRSRLVIRAEDAARWDGAVTVVSDAELAERADAVVSIGGDGTMLGALRLVARRPVPVLGVNLGSLGFLVEIDRDELPDALDRLERGDFTIEQHSALWLGTDNDEAVAFNDLALRGTWSAASARLRAGSADRHRYQRRNQVKLSLLDLPSCPTNCASWPSRIAPRLAARARVPH
jgi:NAD+ kinase